ncbi:endoglucanase 3 [Sarracenia purpurea var. burkii]
MASGNFNQEGFQENIRKQLAVIVGSIQWSYAIFWSISTTQPGVLEWDNGYYNGNIKTRKTVQAAEFNADRSGLERSEQLRELYKSLSTGQSCPQATRPLAALSPEDLTDTEWYYLLSMSFMFNIGQGLPGRTLANGQPIWLCNAHHADSQVFSRSLLAKASLCFLAETNLKSEKNSSWKLMYIMLKLTTQELNVSFFGFFSPPHLVDFHRLSCAECINSGYPVFDLQTVVCFPFLGGVIELGVTEMVIEDPGLIHHIKASFLEIPHPIVSTKCRSVNGNPRINRDPVWPELDDDLEIHDTIFNPSSNCGCKEELKQVCSPNNSSNGIGLNQQDDESFMFEGLNDEASRLQSWQSIEDEDSHCIYNCSSSSDCISLKEEKKNDGFLVGFQEDNQMKPATSLSLQADQIHYIGVVSTLLKSSQQLILGSQSRNCNKKSSFHSWKKGGFMGVVQVPRSGAPQKLLKKVLFEVGRMHGECLVDSSGKDNGINDRFWGPKVDKVSMFDNTIQTLKELKKRTEKFESCEEVAEVEAKTRRKPRETVERTSDNYRNNTIGPNFSSNKPLINKRKTCETGEMEPGINRVLPRDSGADTVSISVTEMDTLIKIRCPWREFLLLEIMDKVSQFHLDSHSVQSTNTGGILSLTIRSKFKGTTAASSAETIRQALLRVVN